MQTILMENARRSSAGLLGRAGAAWAASAIEGSDVVEDASDFGALGWESPPTRPCPRNPVMKWDSEARDCGGQWRRKGGYGWRDRRGQEVNVEAEHLLAIVAIREVGGCAVEELSPRHRRQTCARRLCRGGSRPS
jgi:hypothetical protein